MDWTRTIMTSEQTCGYLANHRQRMEYLLGYGATPEDYQQLMDAGWRRFGQTIYRPRCRACTACLSLRIPTFSFKPNRSQRRVQALCKGRIELCIFEPRIDAERLDLFDRYHKYQASHKGWGPQDRRNARNYHASFIDNPFPTWEYAYFLDEQLVGICYVDELPRGISGIYFFYDPDFRNYQLGTWNILCLMNRAKELSSPYVYLGYYVSDCGSLAYKSLFRPNEILHADGEWRLYQE